jgi:uncharacterized membrane protein
MAAARIKTELSAFLKFAQDGFKYNLQVLPDTLTATTLLFTLLFQSPPMAVLGSAMVGVHLLHPVFAGFLGQVLPAVAKPNVEGAACTGHYPSISYDRVLSMSRGRTFGAVSTATWPSFYSMFLGCLVGYIGVLPALYNKELEASPRRKAASITGLIILAVVVATCCAYRILSGCEDGLGLVVGLFAGAFLGLLLCLGVAWLSDRRLTNILGFPLIRDRAPDGKPIYVCERK